MESRASEQDHLDRSKANWWSAADSSGDSMDVLKIDALTSPSLLGLSGCQHAGVRGHGSMLMFSKWVILLSREKHIHLITSEQGLNIERHNPFFKCLLKFCCWGIPVRETRSGIYPDKGKLSLCLSPFPHSCLLSSLEPTATTIYSTTVPRTLCLCQGPPALMQADSCSWEFTWARLTFPLELDSRRVLHFIFWSG